MTLPNKRLSSWFHRKSRSLALATVLFIASGLVCCSFFRISRPADVEAYLGMASECHAVWKQFAFRRFRAGDSAENLFRQFPPNDSEEFGRYGVYSYYRSPGGLQFTALGVVTRDGKLLTAHSGGCTWRFTFFHSPDSDFDAQYAAYSKAKLSVARGNHWIGEKK